MKIQFNIHYVTQWGQSLYLLLNSSNTTTGNSSEGIAMQCNDKFEWSVESFIDEDITTISYQYAILTPDKSFDYEYGNTRSITFYKTEKTIVVQDFWRGPFGDSPFVSSAFSECFFKRKKTKSVTHSKNTNLILRLNCP
ncbi:MAG: carbohydrate-binding module family 20 domain-containing protein, partial [Paludibacter sp.]